MNIGKFFFPQKFHKYLETEEKETKGIIQFIFGRQHLKFVSQYPPEEAALRLKNNVVEAPLLFCWWWPEDTLMGKVSEKRVKLMWVMGKTKNSFNPIFTGRFTNRIGGSTLDGFYSISWVTKIFLCFWFGGIGFASLIVLIIFLRNQWFNTFSSVDGIEFAIFLFLFLLFAGLIALGGLGLVAFGKRIADDSQRLLIEKIENSIR